MAPCERFTYNECIRIYGLDIPIDGNKTEALIDAALLCGETNRDIADLETISAATVAIVIYLIGKLNKIKYG